MLKMMKERMEEDEQVIGGLLLAKIYLHDPTVIFFKKKIKWSKYKVYGGSHIMLVYLIYLWLKTNREDQNR